MLSISLVFMVAKIVRHILYLNRCRRVACSICRVDRERRECGWERPEGWNWGFGGWREERDDSVDCPSESKWLFRTINCGIQQENQITSGNIRVKSVQNSESNSVNALDPSRLIKKKVPGFPSVLSGVNCFYGSLSWFSELNRLVKEPRKTAWANLKLI